MPRLKSRTEAAIGGFQFIDAPISATPLEDWSFQNLVTTVINRRAQNPRFNLATDFNTVANEIDAQNASRMLSIKGGQHYVVQDQGEPPPPFPPAHRSGLRSVAVRSENVLSGASILRDWLGDGGQPVSPELSVGRAKACADRDGNPCPKNGPGDWLSYFTAPAAAKIRKQLAQKTGLNISTPLDAKLGVCTACDCPLQLKVHTPFEHIKNHTRDEIWGALDKGCWMLKEKG